MSKSFTTLLSCAKFVSIASALCAGPAYAMGGDDLDHIPQDISLILGSVALSNVGKTFVVVLLNKLEFNDTLPTDEYGRGSLRTYDKTLVRMQINNVLTKAFRQAEEEFLARKKTQTELQQQARKDEERECQRVAQSTVQQMQQNWNKCRGGEEKT